MNLARPFGITLIIALSISIDLRAETASGIWKSSTGATIAIPNNPKSFDIVVSSTDGISRLYKGTWNSGARPKQFSYSSGQVSCIFDARDAHRISVTNRTGTNTWKRTHQMSLRKASGNLHSESKTVAGIWVASTGATIIIPSNPKKFVLIVKRPKGKNGAYHGTWEPGRGVKRFRYAVGNNLWVCSVRADNPNRIVVQGSGKTFSWNRTHVMTAVPVNATGGGLRPGAIGGGPHGGHGGHVHGGGHTPQQATRSSVAGVWVSGTGNKIIIPANPESFDLIFKRTDGRNFLLKGRWVAGQTGRQFTYTLKNVATVCTVDSRNQNRIICTVPGNKYVWTRLHANTSRPAR